MKKVICGAQGTDKERAEADWVLTGTNDHYAIQSFIDEFKQRGGTDGGYLKFIGGPMQVRDTVVVEKDRMVLEFEPGTTWNWGSIPDTFGEKAFLKIEASEVRIVGSPSMQGSGTKKVGTGIALGGPIARFGGRSDKQAYACTIENPRTVRLYNGISFGIEEADADPDEDSSSSGDNLVTGGHIYDCRYGISNNGFVNRVEHLRLKKCGWVDPVTWAISGAGLYSGSERSSCRLDFRDVTITDCPGDFIHLANGKGYSIGNIWTENDETGQGGGTCLVRLGGNGPIKGINWYGSWNCHLHKNNPQQHGVFSYPGIEDFQMRATNISTNGGMPASNVLFGGTRPDGLCTIDSILFTPQERPANIVTGWDL